MLRCLTIQCQENDTIYLRHNPLLQSIAKVKVDGGLIRGNDTKKCDWLLINWDERKVFFVELKGERELKKACEQIETAFNRLWPSLQAMGITKPHARIIMKRGRKPNIGNCPAFFLLSEKLKQYEGSTKRKQTPCEEWPAGFSGLHAFHHSRDHRSTETD